LYNVFASFQRFTSEIVNFGQVLAVGGPQPESTVEYVMDDGEIALVSSNGLITAMALGDTRLIGRAVGQDPINGKEIIYSQVRPVH
jgi:hypothetical protein